MHELDPADRAEKILAYSEVRRQELILAMLDPDGLNGERPPGFPADEWVEFVDLCERADAARREGRQELEE